MLGIGPSDDPRACSKHEPVADDAVQLSFVPLGQSVTEFLVAVVQPIVLLDRHSMGCVVGHKPHNCWRERCRGGQNPEISRFWSASTEMVLKMQRVKLRFVSALLQHRELWWRLTERAVASRYKGSALGFGWSLMQPVVMLAVYTFVFQLFSKAAGLAWKKQARWAIR